MKLERFERTHVRVVFRLAFDTATVGGLVCDIPVFLDGRLRGGGPSESLGKCARCGNPPEISGVQE